VHWSQTWQRPKRRSRSKSAKATSYRNPEQNKVSEEGVKDWSVFPGNAPWIPSTPSGRAVNKKTDQSDGAGAKESMVDQSVIQPASSQAAAETLSPEEEKILEHLKGLKSAGIDLTEQMEQQQQKLIAKQQAAAASKALTHGHLNRLTKLKTQVTTAADKVTKLDREWKAFVEATTQKVHQHAELFQKCRSDLLEAYNMKLAEFHALKQEMSSASMSMLGPATAGQMIPEEPNVGEQLRDLEEVILVEGSVGEVDLTDDMDDVEDMGPMGFGPQSKASPKLHKQFRGATSPTKVAQQHLKPKTQEVRDAKMKEKEQNA